MKIFFGKKIDKNKKKEPVKNIEPVQPASSVLLNVLKRPWLSEKATLAKQQNKYFFLVQPAANKNMIKEEIQRRYQVKVSVVNIINKKGKPKRLGRKIGHSQAIKKAAVTLAAGQTLDII